MADTDYPDGPEESYPKKGLPEMATVGGGGPQPRRLRKNRVWGLIIALAGLAVLAFSLALLRETLPENRARGRDRALERGHPPCVCSSCTAELQRDPL